jgi:hypothetical protein
MTAVIAKAAGLALGEVRDAQVVDAIVMASAMLRGDLKYTVDFDDLMRLRGHFPTVTRVFANAGAEVEQGDAESQESPP